MTSEGVVPVWPSVSHRLSLPSKWKRHGGRAKRDRLKCVRVALVCGHGMEMEPRWSHVRTGWNRGLEPPRPFLPFRFLCLYVWTAWQEKVDSLIDAVPWHFILFLCDWAVREIRGQLLKRQNGEGRRNSDKRERGKGGYFQICSTCFQ